MDWGSHGLGEPSPLCDIYLHACAPLALDRLCLGYGSHITMLTLCCAPGMACLGWCELMKSLHTTAGVSVPFCFFIVPSLGCLQLYNCGFPFFKFYLGKVSYSDSKLVILLTYDLCDIFG